MLTDTYLATLPDNWSDHFTQEKLESLVGGLGEVSVRTRLVKYLIIGMKDDLLKLYSKEGSKQSAPIPTEDTRTVHYNRRSITNTGRPAELVSAPKAVALKTAQQVG